MNYYADKKLIHNVVEKFRKDPFAYRPFSYRNLVNIPEKSIPRKTVVIPCA